MSRPRPCGRTARRSREAPAPCPPRHPRAPRPGAPRRRSRTRARRRGCGACAPGTAGSRRGRCRRQYSYGSPGSSMSSTESATIASRPSVPARTVPSILTHCPVAGDWRSVAVASTGMLAGWASMTQWVMTMRVRSNPPSPGVTNPVSVTGSPSYSSGFVAVAKTVDHSPTPNEPVSPAVASATASDPANSGGASMLRDIASWADSDAGGVTSARTTRTDAATPPIAVAATAMGLRRCSWPSWACASSSAPSGRVKESTAPTSTMTAMPTANHVESGLRYRSSRPVAARARVVTARTDARPTPSQRPVSARRRSAGSAERWECDSGKEVHRRSDREGRQHDDGDQTHEHARGEGRAQQGEHLDVHERADEEEGDDRAGREGRGERQREERVDVRADRHDHREQDHREDRQRRVRADREQGAPRYEHLHGAGERRSDDEGGEHRAQLDHELRDAAPGPAARLVHDDLARVAEPLGEEAVGVGVSAVEPADQVGDRVAAEEAGDEDAVVEAEGLVGRDDDDGVDDRRGDEEGQRLGHREAPHQEAARERHVAAFAHRHDHAEEREDGPAGPCPPRHPSLQ